ncbi:MAG: SPOR domain-containing protein [Desulfovibrio sp.]|jgi:cell division protein FtsN|nr:SPOR domain-containing protein [Desulfovibrio sp.]
MPQSLRRSRAKGKIPENAAGRFTVSFSRAAAAALCLVLIMAVGWAFFMGFMVGRGQNPVQRMEQMTAALRDDNPATPGTSGSAQNGQSAGPSATSASDAASGRNPASGEEAAQEDDSSVSPAAPAMKKPDAPLVFAPLNSPEGAALAAWGMRDASAGDTAGQGGTKTAENPPPSVKDAPRYDWVFQMAAFRGRTDADRLRARLEKAGYGASLVRSGKVTLVLVRLRGGKAEAERLRGQAREYRLGEPLLQSRQPVSARKTKR